MTHAESRTITYAIVGSLAVHVVLALAFAMWIGVSSFHRMLTAPPRETEEESEVTLVFPEPPNLDVEDLPPPQPQPPPPPAKTVPYIRTTQNTGVAEAPKDAVFESDRNTVATTTASTSTPDGPALPSMQGRDEKTNELANRSFKDGELKEDSAPETPPAKPLPPPAPPKVAKTPPAPKPEPLPVPPPPPAAPTPAPTPPPVAEQKPKEEEKKEAPTPPPPAPQVAKKEDSPAEHMMKELDKKLAEAPPAPKPEPKPEPPKTLPPPDVKPPIMREAADEVPIPKAIPVAGLVKNKTPKPQEDAFQPETHRSKIAGSISNVGDEDAVAAAATPIGRYQRLVNSIIEKKWHQLRVQRMDAVEPGRMRLRFYVNKSGKIEGLTILEDKASPLFADFTIEAILKAEIPPLPADFVPISERLEMTYDVVIHPK